MDDSLFLEELKKDFFEEAQTLIESIEQNILILENDPTNSESINELFRAAHTLKGGSATLDLDRIASFTHEIESLMDEVRGGNVRLDSSSVDILLKSIDVLKALIEAGMREEQAEAGIEETLIEQIKKIYLEQTKEETEAVKEEFLKKVKESKDSTKKIDFKLNEYERYIIKTSPEEGKNVYEVYILLNSENPMRTVSGIQMYSILKDLGEVIKSIPDTEELMEDQFFPEIYFLFASKLDEPNIKKKLFHTDVTDIIEIDKFTEEIEEAPVEDVKVTELELSEDEQKQAKEFSGMGMSIYKVNIEFDESNPMRSVSGLLVYSMLRERGEIIKSIPTFEQFRSDAFYQNANFIYASLLDSDELHSKIHISDVTKGLVFNTIEEGKPTGKIKSGRPEETKKIPEPLAGGSGGIEPPKPPTGLSLPEKEEPKDEPSFTSKEEVPVSTATSAAPRSITQTSTGLIRVPSERIDQMLTLVGELVIAKAGLNQINEQNNQALDELISINADHKKEIKTSFNEMLDFLESKFGENEELFTEIKDKFKNKYDAMAIKFDKVIPSYKSLEDKFRSTSQGLSRITNELQESVMKVRMVPVNQIFSRFPRLVRDLSKNLNKDIDLVIQGEETELDKGMVEDLIDPLIHMVRNAVDHGIEDPETRDANKKPRKGTIQLKAEHEGNNVSITIQDDGRGLDIQKIKDKAISQKLIEPIQDYSKEEIFQLMFLPGFSTADKISHVSGRGVGLDVVKKKLDNLRGTIQIDTELGKGTTFKIRLPLTTAIIQALMVEVGGYIYSIPIASVIETLRITPDEVELIEGNEVIRVRDEILSLIRLDHLFKFKAKENPEFYYVIIVGVGSKKVGFVVDSLIGEEDIVIKPLNSKYAATPGIAGAALLGDGQITLILDVNAILEFALNQKKSARSLRL